MSQPEYLSRRNFVKVALAIPASVGLGIATEKILRYSTRDMLYSHESDSFLEQKISNNIIVDENNFLNILEYERNGKHKVVQVRVNKEPFVHSIINLITKIEDPEEGPVKIASFLENRPLIINLADKEEVPRVEKQDKTFEQAGGYLPALSGGPEVTFYPTFLRDYMHESLIRNYLDKYDSAVFHELYHVWQDATNPYKYAVELCIYSVKEFASRLGLMPKFEHGKYPSEKEAYDKASILTDVLKEFDYPFGQFFTFETVDK